MSDDRQYAPATLRNRDFILDVLRDVLPMTGVILEIASGSGEHIVHFARNFPALVFQPSDPEPDARLSIAAWMKATGVTNVRAPIALDVSHSVWPIASVLFGIICAPITGSSLPSPPTAMPTISLMVGNPVGANLTLVRPICAMSHCAVME